MGIMILDNYNFCNDGTMWADFKEDTGIDLSGKIVMIGSGYNLPLEEFFETTNQLECFDKDKVLNAEAAGAAGVIIASTFEEQYATGGARQMQEWSFSSPIRPPEQLPKPG